MKVFLWLLFISSTLSSMFFVVGAGTSAVNFILAAIAGVSATVAFSALSIIAAIERFGQPKPIAVPDDI